jgi:imidazolonepropionase-like amidohydrolase
MHGCLSGNGHVIPNGAVLVRNGKIARVFDVSPSNPKALNAEIVDASGKTLLPGLIDMHVHLGSPGGLYSDSTEYMKPGAMRRELAAYLYSGITAVRSVGDGLDQSVRAKEQVASREYLGAELYTCGPMFTTEAGHGTEYSKFLPANVRQSFDAQTVRTPHSSTEAVQQVHDLKSKGTDCIKAILETGAGGTLFQRLDFDIYRSIVKAAHSERLPVATHTGDSQDVHEAVTAGTTSIEHGSMRNNIEVADFKEMAVKSIAYDPTLSVAEAAGDVEKHDLKLLDRSLVQQAAPASLLTSTRVMLGFKTGDRNADTDSKRLLAVGVANLRAAFRAGVELITGSDAGNLLVIHGPTVQRELELWVEAGIPPAVALQAATLNAARVVGQEDRIGSIQEGKDANLILVEGNPLDDISSLERIADVLLRGERVERSELFKQAQN